MKVRVVDRFVGKGRVIIYPGEIIDVSIEQADILVRRGIAEVIDAQPFETTVEYAQQVYKQKAKSGDCGGCP